MKMFSVLLISLRNIRLISALACLTVLPVACDPAPQTPQQKANAAYLCKYYGNCKAGYGGDLCSFYGTCDREQDKLCSFYGNCK